LARLAARDRPILWCLKHAPSAANGLPLGEPYGPGLAAFGLDPDALILAQGRRDIDILWAMEEGLREPVLAAVVGEVAALDLTASRRLQLAAEAHGVTAILLRPNAPGATAAETRWRLTTAPSILDDDDQPGVGTPCWRVELLRCRGGRPHDWLLAWHGPDLGLAIVAQEDESAIRSEAPLAHPLTA
jgi:protein ImuA